MNCFLFSAPRQSREDMPLARRAPFAEGKAGSTHAPRYCVSLFRRCREGGPVYLGQLRQRGIMVSTRKIVAVQPAATQQVEEPLHLLILPLCILHGTQIPQHVAFGIMKSPCGPFLGRKVLKIICQRPIHQRHWIFQGKPNPQMEIFTKRQLLVKPTHRIKTTTPYSRGTAGYRHAESAAISAAVINVSGLEIFLHTNGGYGLFAVLHKIVSCAVYPSIRACMDKAVNLLKKNGFPPVVGIKETDIFSSGLCHSSIAGGTHTAVALLHKFAVGMPVNAFCRYRSRTVCTTVIHHDEFILQYSIPVSALLVKHTGDGAFNILLFIVERHHYREFRRLHFSNLNKIRSRNRTMLNAQGCRWRRRIMTMSST